MVINMKIKIVLIVFIFWGISFSQNEKLCLWRGKIEYSCSISSKEMKQVTDVFNGYYLPGRRDTSVITQVYMVKKVNRSKCGYSDNDDWRSLCVQVFYNHFIHLTLDGHKIWQHDCMESCLLYTSPSPRDS